MVQVKPLLDGQPIPMIVTPTVPGVDLIAWAATHVAFIDRLLFSYNALLFRGFHRQEANQFERFVAQTSQSASLEYRDRTTRRVQVGERIYTSTIYPADRRIHLHNEGTYWLQWPLKLYFACVTAASTGGETPIANVANIPHRLHPDMHERFASLGCMLVRNYNDGFGLPWQDVFQTQDRTAVENFCRQQHIAWEWRDGERLRTRQIRPALRRHPRTGKVVWFNHAAFFHTSTYPPDVYAALVAELGVDNLPYATYYGDGSEIEPAAIAEIHRAYAAEEVRFRWQPGDVLLLDNMTVAHGREPYSGERQILVSMNEAYAE
jgi:alpha-ketoglutarate-dependent taurine dioxygenase